MPLKRNGLKQFVVKAKAPGMTAEATVKFWAPTAKDAAEMALLFLQGSLNIAGITGKHVVLELVSVKQKRWWARA